MSMFGRLGVLALLALGACGEAQAGSTPTPRAAAEVPSARAVRVETATVATTEGTLRIELPGEVKGSRDAMLASALGGFIEAVSAREGQDVRSGAVLLRVDAASHGARVAQACVEVETAERELERSERLRGSISDQQLDAVQARVDAARAAARTASVAASRATIRAPFAGTIATMDVERAGGGQQLLIPSDFLVTRIDGNGVFVHEEGVARWRAVEVGGILRDQVVISSGLRSSEELVVTGHRELADGDPLLVGRRGRCCIDGRVDFAAPTRTAQAPPATRDALMATP